MTTNGAVTAQRRRRFADGGAEKLPLSDGDWVLVRKALTYGQQRRLATAGLSGMPAAVVERGEGERLAVDYAAFEIERLVTWVLDWSFVDGDGDRAVVSREAIEALDPDTADEIHRALDAHVGALEAKKGTPPSATGSAATSPSAKPSAGAGRS